MSLTDIILEHGGSTNGIVAILPEAPPVESPFMLFKEVMDYLRTSRSTVYRLIWSKELPVYYVGKTMRFYRSDVEKCVVRQENGGNNVER